MSCTCETMTTHIVPYSLLVLFTLTKNVYSVCEDGETHFTEKISELRWVNKTTAAATLTYERPDCSGFGGWVKKTFTSSCNAREITKYKLVTVEVLETITVYRNSCCPGYGENIDGICEEGCPSGTFGENCTSNCTCPDNAYDSCERQSGNCTCKNGWTGRECNQTCESGFYGQNCKGRCTCENNSTCDIYTGHCNCTTPGWQGESCETECSSNTYGLYCVEECECDENQSCDHVTGNCTCKPGKTGINCTHDCQNGMFGKDCQENCTCVEQNTEYCNKTDGHCVCRAGFDGQRCDHVCPFGTYGIRCTNRCEDTCNYTRYCDPFSGDCMCMGTRGDNCSQECEDGTYGINCQETCSCTEAEVCHPIFGNCSCLPGQNCLQSGNYKKGLQGEQNEDIYLPILLAVGAALLVVMAIGVLIFVLRRRRQKQTTDKSRDRKPSNDSDTEVVENASYIPLEMKNDKGTDKNRNKHKTSARNTGGNLQFDTTATNTPIDDDSVHQDNSSETTDRPHVSEDDVYDRTDAKVESQPVNTYNTFADVRNANRHNNANNTDDEYNVLNEVKKPNESFQENYETFANVNHLHKLPDEETYNILGEKREKQTATAADYAKVQLKGQSKRKLDVLERNVASDDSEIRGQRDNYHIQLCAEGTDIDVYENEQSTRGQDEQEKNLCYENTDFNQHSGGMTDDDTIYEY